MAVGPDQVLIVLLLIVAQAAMVDLVVVAPSEAVVWEVKVSIQDRLI
jgi:hypothetical protein